MLKRKFNVCKNKNNLIKKTLRFGGKYDSGAFLIENAPEAQDHGRSIVKLQIVVRDQ